MNRLLKKILPQLLFLLLIVNCSELSFRSDPLSMTMVKYENRSPNKYIFLGHEGDDCHLLRHKRIHNFFFFFPLNTFSKEEIHEISQQKMIRYKNIMRLGDFAWTLFLLPITVLTYSIEVETCNTGMVAVTRRDPLYQEAVKNTKTGTKKEEAVAVLDTNKEKPKKNKSNIITKSINLNSDNPEMKPTNEESKEIKEVLEEKIEAKGVLEEVKKIETKEVSEEKNTNDKLTEKKDTKPHLRFKEKPKEESLLNQMNDSGNSSSLIALKYKEESRKNNTNNKENSKDNKQTQSESELNSETVWDSAVVDIEGSEEASEEAEDFNPEIYKIDGTLPIIWNYKNSITNKINENIKPFSILFSKNKAGLKLSEQKKLDVFAKEYLESYSTSKIMLIGHSEWAKGKGVKLTLSQHRAEAVRDYLIQKNVPTENILLTFSGGLWGEKNEEKFGKNFSRRVDIVFLY